MEAHLKQNTPEWLAIRRTKITASQIPVILGISPYQTPLQLWTDKVSGMEPEYTPNMEWGRQNEAFARQAFIEKTGIVVAPEVLVDGIFMASLDGWCPHTKTVVEIKCLKKEDHEAARGGDIAPMYYAQIQFQLMVADSSLSYYVGYRRGDMYYHIIDRDGDYEKMIVKKANEFYDFMQSFTPPPKCERDEKTEEKINTTEDEKWIWHAEQCNYARMQRKKWEEEEKIHLEALVAGANGQQCIGSGYKLAQCKRKGTIDYKRIPELKNRDLEEFRSPTTTFWTLKKQTEDFVLNTLVSLWQTRITLVSLVSYPVLFRGARSVKRLSCL
jgi:putative phage-type endonuclease